MAGRIPIASSRLTWERYRLLSGHQSLHPVIHSSTSHRLRQGSMILLCGGLVNLSVQHTTLLRTCALRTSLRTPKFQMTSPSSLKLLGKIHARCCSCPLTFPKDLLPKSCQNMYASAPQLNERIFVSMLAKHDLVLATKLASAFSMLVFTTCVCCIVDVMPAETWLQVKDGGLYSNCFFPPDLEAAPEWSPVIAPGAPQQQHPHVEAKKYQFNVWRPGELVRRPYDCSMSLCTAHISPYCEVPDDSPSFTETVGQDTCKNLQLSVHLAKTAPAQLWSEYDHTDRLHNQCSGIPTLPEHKPALAPMQSRRLFRHFKCRNIQTLVAAASRALRTLQMKVARGTQCSLTLPCLCLCKVHVD
jgi:hypothetical protein